MNPYWNKHINPKWRIVLLIIFFSLLIYYLNLKGWLNFTISILGILIALIAIFQKNINEWLFEPDFKIKIISIPEIDNIKHFNLKIENKGLSPAKNIRAKIKSENGDEWINLARPFHGIMSEYEDKVYIKRLSRKEYDHFNLYMTQKEFIHYNNEGDCKMEFKGGKIISIPEPHSQKFNLGPKDKNIYVIEIVSDNSKPKKLKIEITNKGFDKTTPIIKKHQ